MQLKTKIGIDLVYLPKYRKLVDNQQFLDKILTKNEQFLLNQLNNPRRKLEFLCGRYASKEAYAKALKVGIGEIDFLDFEVLKTITGQPKCSLDNVEISISHDHNYVIAIVMVGESNGS